MAAEDWGVTPTEKYWFNLKTGAVEYGKLSPASYRLGPFNSAQDAESALQTVQARAAAWAAEDAEADSWGQSE